MAHWLLKSEPDAYGWDDLVRDGGTAWTGVRNASAALNLKAMAVGDEAFFYHSNIGKACVGTVRVTRAAYGDPTDATGRFVAIDVAPVVPLTYPVTLAAIKAVPALAGMDLVRLSRLSVSKVSDAEWAAIMTMAEKVGAPTKSS